MIHNINPYKHSVYLRGIGKQCRTRSDAARRGVWSGFSLFANRIYFSNLNDIEITTQQTLNSKYDKDGKFH